MTKFMDEMNGEIEAVQFTGDNLQELFETFPDLILRPNPASIYPALGHAGYFVMEPHWIEKIELEPTDWLIKADGIFYRADASKLKSTRFKEIKE